MFDMFYSFRSLSNFPVSWLLRSIGPGSWSKCFLVMFIFANCKCHTIFKYGWALTFHHSLLLLTLERAIFISSCVHRPWRVGRAWSCYHTFWQPNKQEKIQDSIAFINKSKTFFEHFIFHKMIFRVFFSLLLSWYDIFY